MKEKNTLDRVRWD